MAGHLGRASIPFFACFCLLVVIVFQILSFASPYWASDLNSDFGLWRYARCVPTALRQEEGCLRVTKAWGVGDWLHAVRGLECLAIIFWALPLVIIPVYMYVALGLYYRCVMGTMTVFTILGTICNIAGVIVFGVEIGNNESWEAGWCIIVAACAGVLGIIAFLIFLVSCCFKPVFTSQSHFMSGFYVEPDRNRLYVVENVEFRKPASMAGGHVNPAMEE